MFRYISILLACALYLVACDSTDTEMVILETPTGSTDAGSTSLDSTTPLPANSLDSMVVSIDAGMNLPSDMALGTLDMAFMPNCENECVTERISWGRIGGRTPYDVNYALDMCRTQVVWIDTPFASNPDAHRCERTISDCQTPDGLDFEQIRLNVEQIKTQGLCTAASVYGIDSRPWDGQVFSIRYDSEECLLGDPCDGTQPNCTDPPAILLEIADQLWSFGREMERNDPSCARITEGL